MPTKTARPKRTPGAPFTILEAAARLGISERLVRRRIHDGLIRTIQDGRRRLIEEAALIEYEDQRRGVPVSTTPTGGSVRRHLRSAPGRRV